jgi:hypothetical protein
MLESSGRNDGIWIFSVSRQCRSSADARRSRLQECGLAYSDIAGLFNVDRVSVWRRVQKFRSGAYTRKILVDGKEFRE